MTIFEEAWSTAGDVVEAAGDGIDSITKGIPGSEWVEDFANGPLRKLARSEPGTIILRAQATLLAVASMHYAGFGNLIGIGLAQLAFSIPGVVRGETLRQAWLEETVWRLTKLAEYFGADLGGDAAKKATAQLALVRDALFERARAAFPDLPIEEALSKLNVSPEDLAREFGVDEHLVAILLAGLRGDTSMLRRTRDEETGARKIFTCVRPALAAIGRDGGSGCLRSVVGDRSVREWLKNL